MRVALTCLAKVLGRALPSGLILMLLNCSSDDPYRPAHTPSFVAGYVRNSNSIPAANVQVDLMGDHWTIGFPFSIQFWEVDRSTCTNANGYFSFQFNYPENREFAVEVHQNYSSSPTPSVTLVPGETKYVNLETVSFYPDSVETGNCR
jgi:hypothetical protein